MKIFDVGLSVTDVYQRRLLQILAQTWRWRRQASVKGLSPDEPINLIDLHGDLQASQSGLRVALRQKRVGAGVCLLTVSLVCRSFVWCRNLASVLLQQREFTSTPGQQEVWTGRRGHLLWVWRVAPSAF